MKGTFHVADPMCKWIVSGGPVPDENDPQRYYEPILSSDNDPSTV